MSLIAQPVYSFCNVFQYTFVFHQRNQLMNIESFTTIANDISCLGNSKQDAETRIYWCSNKEFMQNVQIHFASEEPHRRAKAANALGCLLQNQQVRYRLFILESGCVYKKGISDMLNSSNYWNISDALFAMGYVVLVPMVDRNITQKVLDIVLKHIPLIDKNEKSTLLSRRALHEKQDNIRIYGFVYLLNLVTMVRNHKLVLEEDLLKQLCESIHRALCIIQRQRTSAAFAFFLEDTMEELLSLFLQILNTLHVLPIQMSLKKILLEQKWIPTLGRIRKESPANWQTYANKTLEWLVKKSATNGQQAKQ